MKIAIIYGTLTGNTEQAAEKIADLLGDDLAATLDVAGLDWQEMREYDVVLVGCPTWDIGELQYDWQPIYDDLDEIDLTGVTMAFFGMGDQGAYPDTYQDALGILHDGFSSKGAKVGVGYTDASTHEFEESKALREGKFVGLALDNDCQPDLTDERIEAWVTQLREELSLQTQTSA